MGTIKDALDTLERDGFAVVPDVVDAATLDALLAAITASGDAPGARRRGGNVYARRNLLAAIPAVRTLARSAEIRALVAPILGAECFTVRGILFDKTPGANWKVGWHQDLSVAVRERRDVPGWGPWSEKAGVPHVQPPAVLLERMLAVRLHLDDCFEENGPLRVLPGSHHAGRLTGGDITRRRDTGEAVPCPVGRGGALLLRPLLLHASSSSEAPGHRRVIHLEFAAEPLPDGLRWHEMI